MAIPFADPAPPDSFSVVIAGWMPAVIAAIAVLLAAAWNRKSALDAERDKHINALRAERMSRTLEESFAVAKEALRISHLINRLASEFSPNDGEGFRDWQGRIIPRSKSEAVGKASQEFARHMGAMLVFSTTSATYALSQHHQIAMRLVKEATDAVRSGDEASMERVRARHGEMFTAYQNAAVKVRQELSIVDGPIIYTEKMLERETVWRKAKRRVRNRWNLAMMRRADRQRKRQSD